MFYDSPIPWQAVEFISKVHNLKYIFWSVLQELINIVLEQLETDFNLFNK